MEGTGKVLVMKRKEQTSQQTSKRKLCTHILHYWNGILYFTDSKTHIFHIFDISEIGMHLKINSVSQFSLFSS